MSDAASPATGTRVRNSALLKAIAAFFIAIKLIYLFQAGPVFDEAYYWMWGQHPGLSYFDHPPLHAWLLGLSDAVFGRSLLGLRWMTVATLCGVFYIFHLWAKRIAGADWAAIFWPGVVIYLASPTFGYFTSIAFHDYLLVFLLLASGHFFLSFLTDTDAGNRGRRRDLYFAAILLGLAGLTKYNAVFLGLGVFFFILWRPALRKLLRDPHLYLAAALAIGMQAPVLYWNATTGFASFGFHLVDRHAEGWLTAFNWRTFIDFPAASAVLVSPFLVPVFWRFFTRMHATRFENVTKGLAIWTFWLSSATFVAVSMFDWVYWWWNVAAYVLVLPLAARVMGQKFLFFGHVIFGALVAVYLAVSATVLPLSLLHGGLDFRQARTFGWQELGQALAEARQVQAPDFIASDGMDMASLAGFALDDRNVVALTDRVTQYHYWWDPETHRGEDALIVLSSNESPAYVASQFEAIEKVGQTDVVRFGYLINSFVFYRATNYQPIDLPGQQGARY